MTGDTIGLPVSETALAGALRDLRAQGFCVIEGALGADELHSYRDTLFRIAAFDRVSGWQQLYAYDNSGNANHRIWNLISRDPVFCQLVEHPLALRLVREVLGWPALLSGISANIAYQHGEEEVLHCDQACSPEPWDRPHGINLVWCIDDFTAENGATRIAPKSHLLNRSPREGEALPNFDPLQAKAGSLAVMDGRLWHRTGRNETDLPRAGIFGWYTLPVFLPQENWPLSLNPIVRQFASENLLTLLGFRPQILGRVNGLEPRG